MLKFFIGKNYLTFLQDKCEHPFQSELEKHTSKYVYNKFDLQLFSGEKTEEPTSKRRQDARNKGQVAKSQDLTAVAVLFVAFTALNILGATMYRQIADFMVFIFSNAGNMYDHSQASTILLFQTFAIFFFKTVLPILFSLLIAGMAINYYQVGWMFSTEVLSIKLSKLDPIAGFSRMFSKQALVQLVKSIIKIIIVSYFLYKFAILHTDEIPQLIMLDITKSLQIAGNLCLDLAYRIIIVLFILSVFDYIFQQWNHTQSIKMSKHEIKEEYKQSEGDPKIKAKIKQKQREMAMRRMMQEIPSATVVVTNPTHLAIALKYEKSMQAPLVIAKGKNFLAERIKEIARENKVVIVEDKPLAQALYPLVEIGDVIPPELYQAVAEVLAYVYRLKRRSS